MQIPDLDFSNARFQADPYPAFARLRTESPAGWHPGVNAWIFTRHADIQAILRDRRFGRAHPDGDHRGFPPAFSRMHHNTFMEMNPPDHTRLRSLVSKVFTPGRVESLRGPVQRLTDEFLNEWPAAGPADFISFLASPLPVAVIAELLALPASERQLLQPWSHAIVEMYEVAPSWQVKEQAETAVEEFSGFLREHIAYLRQHPGQDLLSALTTTQVDQRTLTEEELVATAILLLNAGHEATVNAAGNGLYALLQSPAAWQSIRSDRSLLRTTVEEMLRYDPPLQYFRRYALEDLEIGGMKIGRGESVGLLFGSANRDEKAFEHADTFDIHRHENPHLTFGAGIHFCLGAPLARLELQVMLSGLLTRFPNLHLHTAPEYKASFVLRGLKSLMVEA